MSNTVQAQPSIVLRPTYDQLRVLLAIAAIVIVALTIAVAVLATNEGTAAVANSATRATATATHARAAAIQPSAVASSRTTGAPRVRPNPDEGDLLRSASTFPPAGPNPDQATP
jgi:hypothetical protein